MPKQQRIFAISSNNRGLLCPFQRTPCQEGYCRECQIYFDWEERKEIILICAWCNQVISGEPNPFERPVVSNGLCPECRRQHFPETVASQDG